MGAEEMIRKGRAKLEEHYRNMPPSVYLECGQKGGINTAVCLKEAKHRVASADAWIAKWEAGMRA